MLSWIKRFFHRWTFGNGSANQVLAGHDQQLNEVKARITTLDYAKKEMHRVIDGLEAEAGRVHTELAEVGKRVEGLLAKL